MVRTLTDNRFQRQDRIMSAQSNISVLKAKASFMNQSQAGITAGLSGPIGDGAFQPDLFSPESDGTSVATTSITSSARIPECRFGIAAGLDRTQRDRPKINWTR